MTTPIRIAVSGAAGRISYALLFRIAAGGMFGSTQPVELRLLEVPPALPLLDATIMELNDCAFPLLANVRASADAREAFEGADWIILIGGAHYQPGISRLELLKRNGPIFLEHGRAINEAAKTARVLVVANPCNTNCLIAKSVAQDVPPEHWFAMTRLDQSRARMLLAEKAAVPVEKVNRVTVWGDHGSTIFPDFRNAFIDDQPISTVITDADWVRQVWEPTVRGRGRILLAARGGSPAGSAAQAIIATIRSLTVPTPFGHYFSVAGAGGGPDGVPPDRIFIVPLRAQDGRGWSIVPSLYLDEYAQERIAENVTELQYQASMVTDLLGGG